MKYVIIGNSAAAVGAVTGIRKIDKNGKIVIISKEKYLAYSRPSISSLLAGKITMEKMPYRKKEFYDKNGVELMLDAEVSSIDTSAKKLNLTGSRKVIKYENLLVATGGKPFLPPIKGLDKEDILTFTTLDDSLKLKKLSEKIHDVVIVGGGLIGLKAAEGLIKAGINVTVLELAPRVLSAAFDNVTSKIIQNAFKQKGVKIITGDTADEIIKEDGKIVKALLKSGKSIKCDAVIVAIGVMPNTDVLDSSNIKTNRGILIDDYMTTSDKSIYAAGDVAEGFDMVLGKKRVLPIWTNAYVQGKVAGINMAGKKLAFTKLLPMNSITFCDVPIISMGFTEAPNKEEYKVIEKNDIKNNIHKRIILKDNVLVGCCFVTNIDRAGIITGLMKDSIDVSDYIGALLDDDFSFAHFTKEFRAERLKTVNKAIV